MLCLELWYNTVLVLLTGNMKNAEVEIDALSICLNINGWEMMISLGFLAAASVRVSNELGRGSSKAAKFSIVVTVLTSLAIGFVLFIFFLFFRGRVAYIFTESHEVAAAVADLSPLLACSILLNSVQPVLSGVAVGAGWQSIVAYVNLACYYLVGIPIGAVLGYIFNMKVKGVWIGMLIGTFVQTIVLLIITYKTDWDKQVSKARQHIDKWFVEAEQPNANSEDPVELATCHFPPSRLKWTLFSVEYLTISNLAPEGLRTMDNTVEERLLRSEVEDVDGFKRRLWEETKKIWRVAFPGVLARVTSFGMLVVTQSFIGHISELNLAAYALVQTLIVRFINGILIGMSSATETLCGQAFGAGQNHMMGIYLQRSWIVDFVTAIIFLPLFIFATPIFKALGETDAIAAASENISLWFIPFALNFVFGLTIQMFLQAQLKNMIVAWLSTVSFLLHLILSWIFVSKLNWGVTGAMVALNISAWLMTFGEFVYIFGGWCPQSWKGFSTAAFRDILPVVKLSISSGLMICLELWYNSVLVLLAGYMKNAEVAISAFSICLNVSGWQFMICLGFLGAACVRVANELGRGDAKATKFSIKVVICTSVSIGVFFFILCLVFGRNIAYLFTTSEEVVEAVSDLSVLLAFSMLLNSIYPVLSGK
ncbi:hypothetical protein F0562_016585 [Nyssa sinensis]|uniref:Protein DETOXIFICATION n=1 Tax=Nyssa sinensis TaxID=561372 RepID=A0A5J4ZF54_9ASTE|nr:hypothetical protein F0562_016585 [Nyssa sinensis]